MNLIDVRAEAQVWPVGRLGCSAIMNCRGTAILQFALRDWPEALRNAVDWRLNVVGRSQPRVPERVSLGGGRLPTGRSAYSGIAVFEHVPEDSVVAASGFVAGECLLSTESRVALAPAEGPHVEVFDTSFAAIAQHIEVVEGLTDYWFGSPAPDQVIALRGHPARIGALEVTPLYLASWGPVWRVCVGLDGAESVLPHFWQIRLGGGPIVWAMAEVHYAVADLRLCHLLLVRNGGLDA
jgi:hypothetical protein